MVNKCDLSVYGLIIFFFTTILLYDDRISFLETEWFQKNWTISLYIATVYVTVVALGQRRSSNRSSSGKIKTRLLKYWNFALSVFSTFGTYRVGCEFWNTWSSAGITATFCSNQYFHSRSIYFWYFLFVISKVGELGDTIFILVDGKRSVRFIHWFHHMITMVYAFYIAAYLPAIGRWMSVINFSAHSLMYSYYFITACRVKVSRKIAMIITTIQTLQMFVCFAILIIAFMSKRFFKKDCQNGGYTVEAGLIMYAIYMVMFVNFFRKSYINKCK